MAEGSSTNYTQCEKKGSTYVNQWGDWPHGYYKGLGKLIKWVWSLGKTHFKQLENVKDNLPIYKPNFKDKPCSNNSNIIVTWLGHASILLEIEGFKILCDPVFSKSCGPLLGIKRYRDSPCQVKDLPEIDAVVISHNHYDHMDSATIKELSEKQKNLKWYIPNGDKNYLCGMMENNINESEKINEMKWWDESEIKKEGRTLTIAFTPTQHWSNRGLFDAFKSLWGSWAFVGEKTRFWFGGDTGYCGAFKEIGRKYGPFTGAAIPIGAYKPRDLLKFQHCDPCEAVQIHEDIQSNVSFGIHWGTFKLSEEEYMDPKYDLEKCVKEKNDKSQEKIQFITINHGETLTINDKGYEIYKGQLLNETQ